MPTLLLSELEPTGDRFGGGPPGDWALPLQGRTNFRLDRDAKISGSSLVGTILAGRYKILETTGVESFKGHDLALDQAVTVRKVLPTAERAGENWRQKVHQLASVRNPNFLNVLAVVSEESSDFVISERSRGRSVAELLSEGSRFDLEEVLALMTPLAGALNLAASFACSPNLASAHRLFTESRRSFADSSDERSLPELPPFFVRLDVWELVRPRKDNTTSFLTWRAQKEGSKRLAVRQAAVLTYELLGGENQKETEVKRWFKPINQLGTVGNSILCRGLQGSARFKTSESFFQKLESAIRSEGSKECHVPALLAPENSMAYPGANDVLRRFNRDTECLAAGLLGGVVFAVLAFAALVPERYTETAQLTKDARQAQSEPLLHADATIPVGIVDLNTKRSTSGIASGTAADANQGLTAISLNKNLVRTKPAAEPTPSSVVAFGPEISRPVTQAKGSKGSPPGWQDFAPMIRTKIAHERHRPFGRPRFVDVKTRLIALWRQSLLQSEKPPSWAKFSSLNRKKRAAYTTGREP